MPPQKHALLGASKAERWLHCAGSVEAGANAPPQPPSEYAAEGTVAHALAERCLKKGKDAADFISETFVSSGFQFQVDEDMAGAVQQYVDAVRSGETRTSMTFVERKFTLDSIAPDELKGLLFGTSDAIVVDAPVLHVFDLKFGRGIVVEVEDNDQLLYYALGALLEIEESHPQFVGQFYTIRMTIVQPRSYHAAGAIRSVEVSYFDLLAWAAHLIRRAAATLEPGAPRSAGDWCRFCPAQAVCPEAHEASQTVAVAAFEDGDAPVPPQELPLAVILDVIAKAPKFEEWLRAARAHVLGLLERGAHVPGWKLVARRAHRKWVDEEATAVFAKRLLAEAEVYTTKIKSPAELERALKKVGKTLPDELVHKPNAGHSMAPANDPRPALPASVDAFRDSEA